MIDPLILSGEGRPVRSPGGGPVHSLKLVYWGPGRSGKTTNLTWLHARLRPELQGRLITLDSPGERTLYFDCLPLELDAGGGPKVRLRLYTVPGQPRFRLTRRIVLQGVDGLVFVWDSRSRRLRANMDSLLEARDVLAELGRSWAQLPRLIQYNKRDLAGAMDTALLDDITARLGETGPRVNTVALDGTGVLESLGRIARAALRRRLSAVSAGERRRVAGGPAVATCERPAGWMSGSLGAR
jgi:mutual gliding-motility protein MglA